MLRFQIACGLLLILVPRNVEASWGNDCHKPGSSFVCNCDSEDGSNPAYYENTTLWICSVHEKNTTDGTMGELVGFALRKASDVNLNGESADLSPFSENSVKNYRGIHTNKEASDSLGRFDNPEGGGWLKNDIGSTDIPSWTRVWVAETSSLTQASIILEFRFIRADICSYRWKNGRSAIVGGKSTGSTCASRKAILSCKRKNNGNSCNTHELVTVISRA
jgi:hypothetical protein